MKKLMMTGLTAAVLSFSAGTSAGEVDQANYTAPEAGQPATAAEIDGNFQALITAINDNAARIAELESSDVSGKTYQLRELGLLNAADTEGNVLQTSDDVSLGGGFARTVIVTLNGTLEFNADSTFDIAATDELIELQANPISQVAKREDQTFTATGTWSQSANLVTLNFPDGLTIELTVSKGAAAFTYTVADFEIVAGTCRLEDTNSSGTPDTEFCLHEYERSLGTGVLVDSQ